MPSDIVYLSPKSMDSLFQLNRVEQIVFVLVSTPLVFRTNCFINLISFINSNISPSKPNVESNNIALNFESVDDILSCDQGHQTGFIFCLIVLSLLCSFW